MKSKMFAKILVVLALSLGAARPARATLFDLYAAARAGGGWGRGVNTLQSSSADYFKTTHGPGFGAQVGVRLLFLDLALSGTQFVSDNGLSGTYFDAILGVGGSIALGDSRSPADYLRLGVGGGFGIGTTAPVDPPLDNAQIRNKGVVGQATIAWDHFLGRFMSVGLEVNAGYHYFFLGGDAVANNMDNQSQGIHVLGFLTFRFHLIPGRDAEPQHEPAPEAPVTATTAPIQQPGGPPPPDAFAPPREPATPDGAPALAPAPLN